MSWDRSIHDFKIVKLGSTHCTTFQYNGKLGLDITNFITSCSCTKPEYNKETRILKVGMNMGEIGIKTTSVSIKYDGVLRDIIYLKAQIV